MKKTALLALTLGLLLIFSGCGKKSELQLPFEPSQVEEVTIYHFTVPAGAEKKSLTEKEEIEALCQSLREIPLQEKKMEETAGTETTSFRFTLSDGSKFEMIYVGMAVKSGRIRMTAGEQAFFTSADIGGLWTAFDAEAVPAQEAELPSLPLGH